MRQQVLAGQAAGHRHVRSTNGRLVCVDDPSGSCPVCGGAMRVQKTGGRHGVTLAHGHFVAREAVFVCAARCRTDGALVTRRSATLAACLPPKGTVGYDVIVFVGLARLVEDRQREEIRAALKTRHGIVLSAGEISALGRRFLVYLEALHEARAGRRTIVASEIRMGIGSRSARPAGRPGSTCTTTASVSCAGTPTSRA